MHVLIVEDDPGQAQMYSQYLQAKGFRVTTVASALAALSKQWPEYDLVITDLMMRDLTGDDMILRAAELFGADRMPPVLLFSAVDRRSLRQLSNLQWPDGTEVLFWSKGQPLASLTATVEQALSVLAGAA